MRAKELLELLEKEFAEDIGGGSLSNGVSPGGIGGMGASNYAGAISPGGGISLNNLGRPLASGVGGGAFRKGRIGLISSKYPDSVNKETKKKLKQLKKKGLISAKDLINAVKSQQDSIKGKRVSFY